ncbi:polysaccharide deacetylase family protein [Spirillospora sp. NBC_00431]
MNPPKSFPFVVSVHDVAPSTATATRRWLADLDERGVPATLLLIPAPFGDGPALPGDPVLVGHLHEAAARGHELALHGYRHAGVPGGPRWRRGVNRVLVRGAGEFWTLTEQQAVRRLRDGLDLLADAGIEVAGFTPPGWLASPGTRRALSALGFAYWTSHLAVHRLPDGPVRRMPALSHRPGAAGERAGARLMVDAARTFARLRMPFRIALHPADLARPGLRRAALTAVDLAVAAGGRATTYEALVTA